MKKTITLLIAGIVAATTSYAIPKPEHFEDRVPLDSRVIYEEFMGVNIDRGTLETWDKDGDGKSEHWTYRLHCNEFLDLFEDHVTYTQRRFSPIVEIYCKKMDILVQFNPATGDLEKILGREEFQKLVHITIRQPSCPSYPVEPIKL